MESARQPLLQSEGALRLNIEAPDFTVTNLDQTVENAALDQILLSTLFSSEAHYNRINPLTIRGIDGTVAQLNPDHFFDFATSDHLANVRIVSSDQSGTSFARNLQGVFKSLQAYNRDTQPAHITSDRVTVETNRTQSSGKISKSVLAFVFLFGPVITALTVLTALPLALYMLGKLIRGSDQAQKTV